MVLNKQEIRTLIKEKTLIAGYVDLETQLTPNGFDLSVASIHAFNCQGHLDFSNKERKLPDTAQLAAEKAGPQDAYGWWQLKPGVYKIVTNETVKLSDDLIAVSFPRSSLLRMGVFTHTGVWDAGFTGKSEFILVVENPMGLRLKENARVVQLVFMRMNATESGYSGDYQGLGGK